MFSILLGKNEWKKNNPDKRTIELLRTVKSLSRFLTLFISIQTSGQDTFLKRKSSNTGFGHNLYLSSTSSLMFMIVLVIKIVEVKETRHLEAGIGDTEAMQEDVVCVWQSHCHHQS